MTTSTAPKADFSAMAPAASGAAALERNIGALWRSSSQAARAILAIQPRADLEFFETADGVLGAGVGLGSEQRLLCSRRRPLEEAQRLAETVDLKSAAGVVVLGFGTGHHIRVLAERMKRTGIILVFEPDVALLRGVLERIDHSSWLGTSNVVLLTDAEDTGAIAAATRGSEGLLALGVQMVEHPASRARLGATGQRFAERFTSVMRAVRTTVVTTLVQSEVTIRNLVMNLDRYSTGTGVSDLAGVGAGRPAILVSAGPSLRRNIELLGSPGVRERFVIIAVQTVLKQLLARGIRPHFVTALDYHEISRRFYEGLTAEAVDGVTLVAEAKANPAILDAFPGEIRIVSDRFLDRLLGDDLVRPLGTLRAGATVAHLGYYLARHLGCDPVVLVGQDLGFTDGQYYAAGAAIHDVWAGELSQFNTLEMMEWQRIARARSYLHRTCDVGGRAIYTDEQMAAYLVQFERDFAADAQAGLQVIDATEGGVEKQHTRPMALAAALESLRPQTPLRLGASRSDPDPGARLALVDRRLRKVRQDTWNIARHSRRTAQLLEAMLADHADQARVNRLIGEVDAIRAEVERLEPAFSLVDHLNQTGTLKRARADRTIELEESLTPMERQRRQIERDIVNVRWLGDAAERLGELLDDAIGGIAGAPKHTGDLIAPADVEEEVRSEGVGAARAASAKRTVAALIPLEFSHGGMGTARQIDEVFLLERNPLRLLVERLGLAKQLDSIVVLTDDPERAAGVMGFRRAGPRQGPSTGSAVLDIVETDLGPLRERRRALLGARLWARSCWRGGLGSLSIYDEVCAPALLAPVMEARGIDAAAIMGPDWALIDPGLVDAAVERYRQRPLGKGAHRLTFCQAPPGLGTCIIERTLMRELANRGSAAGTFATIGGMLGYAPMAPASDPIALPVCIKTSAAVRDAQFRFIPDSEPRRAALVRALAPLGADVLGAVAERIVGSILPMQLAPPEGPPQELLMELCTGRRTSGARSRWVRGAADPIERRVMPLELAERILTEFGRLRTDGALTLHGAGDPLLYPDLFRVIRLARRAGVAGVHIRTDLLCERELLDALLDSGVDVISVDLMAESASVYRAIMGADQFQRVRGNLEYLLTRRAAGDLPTPWIVPRLTRCDGAYEEIEPFFDRWLLATGSAVIDPLPAVVARERIAPLPQPASAVRRLARERMSILSDGRVPADDLDFSGDRCISDVSRSGVMGAWRTLCSRRFDPAREMLPAPGESGALGSPARAGERSR
jgi:hypothetical protein